MIIQMCAQTGQVGSLNGWAIDRLDRMGLQAPQSNCGAIVATAYGGSRNGKAGRSTTMRRQFAQLETCGSLGFNS